MRPVRRLEREIEAGNVTVNAGSGGLIWQIAKDLGLESECRMAQDENGLSAGWIVPRHGEELAPLVRPAAQWSLTRFKQRWTKPPAP